ncbi:hypothetical protein ANCCAN_00135 [Ancylostoma caninum]|uniref:Uncharacterized protein n=1 Tax=Ancylostoma caninum TaxID=29170 RepID=A0A368HAK9_ANCCA|nr:hypothetical protein ANCCAN_00135 [Ancylostoma caninum]
MRNLLIQYSYDSNREASAGVFAVLHIIRDGIHASSALAPFLYIFYAVVVVIIKADAMMISYFESKGVQRVILRSTIRSAVNNHIDFSYVVWQMCVTNINNQYRRLWKF